jgi:hypothetical protein
MNRLGEEFLAHARLAEDEHGEGIDRCRSRDPAGLRERRTLAQKVEKRIAS